MKRILIIMLFFVFCFSLGKTQKTIPFSQQKKKVPIKDINFRNYQFTWADSLKNDSITFSWFTHTDKFKTLFPECELFNPGENLSKGDFYIPNATRFNQHVIQNFEFDSDSLLFRVTEVDEKNLSKQFMPFYFKNVEVTNGEYKEFVRYVRDSIARKLLANYHPEKYLKIPKDFKGDDYSSLPLNWEVEFNYYDPELIPILAPMYFPDHERFYWQKQFDTRKLVYKYYTREAGKYNDIPGITDGDDMQPHSIQIYPDTNVWTNNFYFSGMDPMRRNYFWHEAYDDYPVVGINFAQAQAFCIWKTEQINKIIKKKNLPFIIEVSLPKEYEWEYVQTEFHQKNYTNNIKNKMYNITSYYERMYNYLSLDLDWKSDLILQWSDIFIEDYSDDTLLVERRKKIKRGDNMNFIICDNHYGEYYKIAEFGPYTKKYFDKKADLFKVNHLTMAYNVSEWIDQDFGSGYENIWSIRIGSMIADTLNNHNRTFRDEILNYSILANNLEISSKGKLVRGSNWFDKGIPEELPFSYSFANRKQFVHSDSAYSTVGFRYVIRLKPKC